MDIGSFVSENALPIIPALWFIGKIIKNTNLIKDKYIPFILTAISLVFTPIALGGFTPENILQAVFVVSGAVLGNEFIKQANKPE